MRGYTWVAYLSGPHRGTTGRVEFGETTWTVRRRPCEDGIAFRFYFVRHSSVIWLGTARLFSIAVATAPARHVGSCPDRKVSRQQARDYPTIVSLPPQYDVSD